MKKRYSIIFFILILFLSSCGSSRYKSKKKMPDDVLEQFYVEDLPKLKASKGKYEESLSTPRLFLIVEQEDFDGYAKEIYDYLSNQSFEYFGYKNNDRYSTIGDNKIYTFLQSDNFEDFKNEETEYYGYSFVYTKNSELSSLNMIQDDITLNLVYYYNTQTHTDSNDKKGNFEYNCIITFSDNLAAYWII